MQLFLKGFTLSKQMFPDGCCWLRSLASLYVERNCFSTVTSLQAPIAAGSSSLSPVVVNKAISSINCEWLSFKEAPLNSPSVLKCLFSVPRERHL